MARFNRRQAIAALGAVSQLLKMDDYDPPSVSWPDGVADSDMKEARDVLEKMIASLTPGRSRK